MLRSVVSEAVNNNEAKVNNIMQEAAEERNHRLAEIAQT